MPEIDRLATNDEERQEHIVTVLAEAFAQLIENDPRAFRRKFRTMARTRSPRSNSTSRNTIQTRSGR